tara:strand:- start:1521 stop:1640 length:120 start_codon:yes stop_codon:yes gene_type:complete
MGLFTINRTGSAIICYGMRALWQKNNPRMVYAGSFVANI